MFNFDNSYHTLSNKLYTIMDPEPVSSPEVTIFNNKLQNELGIEEGEFAEFLSGNIIPEGAEPLAQAYAGHQFGQLNILGDGRAILLGEHLAPDGSRYDIQLKGSGRTPYSRGGDGRGTIYSMYREYLISHAMFKLNIPTTRSLAVVSTGEDVYRENIRPGGIVTRIASSHIRVGTFVYVALQKDDQLLKEFADYVINRHYPDLNESDNPYLALLKRVMLKQIDLVVNWMRVGFIHGVMNTDNVSISGETIDYGPCAFMDSYDPDTVFSSIDRRGRYSFENQKNICAWNITRFAETLIPLVDSDNEKSLNLINGLLESFIPAFESKWNDMMAAKIGIVNPSEDDIHLIKELLERMYRSGLDYTLTFSNLHRREEPELESWFEKWDSGDIDFDLMKRTNPAVIPRNHIVEEALMEAEKSNLQPLKELLNVLSNPYDESISDYYRNPPESVDHSYRTFCGT